ncbi:NERD domain-containing protein [Leptolyngbya sp. CCNP1308]|uniref:NERD domain-containing protein n=1 Tax=Leptolyngbya sp. CCNP1308 TaxID=3110255 RepID=UPI002B1F9156|nr:NERD domain-containing protein [Leptolyngbya sp. CCNP1308]MEA5447598.1 NERD domain-containing protein [Leptolyngbya sp. CCNP1308]
MPSIINNPVSRFLYVFCFSFGASALINQANHRGYWDNTIYRVQTVDFNILSHTLPTKLSYALMAGDEGEIQRTLDSNYGHFGLVVTNCTIERRDCPGEEVRFKTDSNFSWSNLLDASTLAKSEYDLLRDPPPLYAEGKYNDARDDARKATGFLNQGEVIGRVYYVRGVSPNFFSSYFVWIRSWPEGLWADSGAKKYYALTTLFAIALGFASWIVIELTNGKWKQQKRISESLLRQKEAESEAQELRFQNQLNDYQLLESQFSDSQKLIQLHQQTIYEKEIQLKNLNRDRGQAVHQIQQLKNEIQIKDNKIKADEQSRIDIQKQLLENKELLQQKEKELGSAQQSKLQDQQKLEQELNQLLQDREKLSQQLLTKDAQVRSEQEIKALYEQQLDKAHQEKDEAEKRAEEVHHSKEEMVLQNQSLAKENERFKQQLSEVSQPNQDANEFEKEVIRVLDGCEKIKSREWEYLFRYDASRDGKCSQATDFVVIGQSFLAVIEAKGYGGKIISGQNILNSRWYCQNSQGHKIEVMSSWGINPYMQVDTYAKSLMRVFEDLSKKWPRLKKSPRKRIAYSYGIVVFKSEADISDIPMKLSEFRRVTTLDNLISTIESVEQDVKTLKAGRLVRASEIMQCIQNTSTFRHRDERVA